uniref:HTH myb-type domain-containing protein n=1 Tax=Rhizophagus irregularis (strain DAOM 181602 / DAOM 197198 / MUCL 43194) TaxID=747089 RepID=U9TS94_RHIID
MPLFDDTSKNIILNFKQQHGYDSNDYVGISRLIPPFTPKQIRHFWTNILDPRLNHSCLDKEEEDYTVTWIENRVLNGPINWGELINDIQQRFGKLRPKNKIKNFWYSRLRRRRSGQLIPTAYWHNSTVPHTLQPKPDPPQFNEPHRMNPF